MAPVHCPLKEPALELRHIFSFISQHLVLFPTSSASLRLVHCSLMEGQDSSHSECVGCYTESCIQDPLRINMKLNFKLSILLGVTSINHPFHLQRQLGTAWALWCQWAFPSTEWNVHTTLDLSGAKPSPHCVCSQRGKLERKSGKGANMEGDCSPTGTNRYVVLSVWHIIFLHYNSQINTLWGRSHSSRKNEHFHNSIFSRLCTHHKLV